MNKDNSHQDVLGITPYADAIVKEITDFFSEDEKNRESSFNVLISAQWGIGKTFILKNISSQLKENGFKTFIFNPWKYSQSVMAIKRKFLQSLHFEFGGNVDLDQLYEGIEGEKQKNFLNEILFVSKIFLRTLAYGLVISLGTILLLQIYNSQLPNSFKNFFDVLFTFLKIEDKIEPQYYILEIGIVIGILGALIPSVKFVFESLSIKTKRAEVDSVEQFEEIFTKIVDQKRHPFVLSIYHLIKRVLLITISFFCWDVFFLAWLDDWKLRPYNLLTNIYQFILEKIKNIFKKYPKTKWAFEKYSKTIFKHWIESVKKPIIDRVVCSVTSLKFPKIAILIDDLDRCEEKEVKNILDGFLTFFEKKNCTYIVTADHTVIERHIANQLSMGQNENISHTDEYSSPKEYLHKIFNLNFLVPSPPKNNMDIFLEKTASIFDLPHNSEISNFAFRFFKRNPRAIRRFYTKVKFNKNVAENILRDKSTDETRSIVANLVSLKPELKAKVIALEMVTPKFFQLIADDPQIAEDCEATESIDKGKNYFESSTSLETKTHEWTAKEKQEIAIAEQILNTQPYIADENIGYEMLINFSSSTYSTTSNIFDWPLIQQDIEKGESVFKKIYRGTSNQGREAIRNQSLESYKNLKTNSADNRHLTIQGMIEIAQVSARKDTDKEKAMQWVSLVLDEISNEPDEILSKIEPKDYTKLLEVFNTNSAKQSAILTKLLSDDPYRKSTINTNIFQIINLKTTKDDDGVISQLTNEIIESTSNTYKGIVSRNPNPNHEEMLINIYTKNYQADEQSISQANRINYMNGLLYLLSNTNQKQALINKVQEIKLLEDKTLLESILPETWGAILSALDHSQLNDIIEDPDIKSRMITRLNLLKDIPNEINNWEPVRIEKILKSLKSILLSLPPDRKTFNEEQNFVMSIFIASILQSRSTDKLIIEFIIEVLPQLINLLDDDEKEKINSLFERKIEIENDIAELIIIRDFSQSAQLLKVYDKALSKIKSLSKSKRQNNKKKKTGNSKHYKK